MLFQSRIVNLLPMDKLQRQQMGCKLLKCKVPPLLSGTLWPMWKSNAVIMFPHQRMVHGTSNLRPTFLIHICSRNAFGTCVFTRVGLYARRDLLSIIYILMIPSCFFQIWLKLRCWPELRCWLGLRCEWWLMASTNPPAIHLQFLSYIFCVGHEEAS